MLGEVIDYRELQPGQEQVDFDTSGLKDVMVILKINSRSYKIILRQ
jgi:hypothetical protein